MMPPPTMYHGPGNPGKMYPSGMMMHPGGNVGMPPSSSMYSGQPYGVQPHPGLCLLAVRHTNIVIRCQCDMIYYSVVCTTSFLLHVLIFFWHVLQ